MRDKHAGWETNVYGQGKQMNQYTFGEVYYFTNRYLLPGLPAGTRAAVLELGSGAGNNLTYFAELGMAVAGIEYSATACAEARRRLAAYPAVAADVRCGDFCALLPGFPDAAFDLVLDRGALTHNVVADLHRVLAEVQRVLKPGGRIFSINFFSDKDSRYGRGELVDANTYRDIGGHTFQDVPMVHYSNLAEIRELYRDFTIEFLEENAVKRYYPYENEQGASFNLIARKKTDEPGRSTAAASEGK